MRNLEHEIVRGHKKMFIDTHYVITSINRAGEIDCNTRRSIAKLVSSPTCAEICKHNALIAANVDEKHHQKIIRKYLNHKLREG